MGFDFDGAEFTHVDNRVTFEVLLVGFGLEGVRGAGTRATLLSNALGFLGALGNGNGGGGGAGGGGSNNGNGPPSGTPAGTTPGGTTPPVALGRLTLIKRTLHVNRLTRRTSVRFKCPVSTASGRCTGQIRLQRGNAGLAQRAFSIPADRYTTVAVGLTRSAYRKLVKAKHLRTVVSVLTRDRLGRLQRVQATMTLVLAKR